MTALLVVLLVVAVGLIAYGTRRPKPPTAAQAAFFAKVEARAHDKEFWR